MVIFHSYVSLPEGMVSCNNDTNHHKLGGALQPAGDIFARSRGMIQPNRIAQNHGAFYWENDRTT